MDEREILRLVARQMIQSSRANGTHMGEVPMGALRLDKRPDSLWQSVIEILGGEEEILRQ